MGAVERGYHSEAPTLNVPLVTSCRCFGFVFLCWTERRRETHGAAAAQLSSRSPCGLEASALGKYKRCMGIVTIEKTHIRSELPA